MLRSLTRAAEAPPLPEAPERAAALRWSFPDWIAAPWTGRYGIQQAEALMRALNDRPPLTVRANRRRATREALIARLREEELIEARPTGRAPEGVLIPDGGRPGQWRAFADGWCVVQDEASMLVARLLDPRPGEIVVHA